MIDFERIGAVVKVHGLSEQPITFEYSNAEAAETAAEQAVAFALSKLRESHHDATRCEGKKPPSHLVLVAPKKRRKA